MYERIKVGDRIQLKISVDRFDIFIAPQGLTGTITYKDEFSIIARMDEKLQGDGSDPSDFDLHWYQNFFEWKDLDEDIQIIGSV